MRIKYTNNKIKLCSACLMGINCKYNSGNNQDEKVMKLLAKGEILIPVCPEQLGGLAIPRKLAAQRNGKVFTEDGLDITENYKRGAEEVLKIAKLYGIKEAILKQRSPSCGSGQIYNGTFFKKVIKGDGIATALLKKNGIKVIS